MTNWLEFEVLKGLTGDAYRAQRNALLSSTPDIRARLRGLADGDWRTEVTGRILSGWLEHRDTYLQVLSELDKVDVARESQTVVGISRIWTLFADRAGDHYGEDILPLCWEVLLKSHAEFPEWKQITFLRMLEAVPSTQSVEPLIWFVEHSRDATMRRAAATTLARFPADMVRPAIENAATRHAHLEEIFREALGELE